MYDLSSASAVAPAPSRLYSPYWPDNLTLPNLYDAAMALPSSLTFVVPICATSLCFSYA